MFDVITREEYFEWYNLGLIKTCHDLKSSQDAFILSNIKDKKGLKIAEIGGGCTRILGGLGVDNECWNIDKLGSDTEGIKLVRQYIGLPNDVPSDYFDIVFSISVIEHLKDDSSIFDFFKDVFRIMKHQTIMLHAIDHYVSETELVGFSKCISLYINAIRESGFKYLQEPSIDDKLRFKCCFASNCDFTSAQWSNMVPGLVQLNKVAQCISLKVLAIKE